MNNYIGAFDDSSKYVLSPFFIPITEYDTKEGKAKPTRKYIELSHD